MRPLALAPIALLLCACAVTPAPAQYQPAPTASLAPDVAANLYAAQVAATQAQAATNAVQAETQAAATATWSALAIRQAEAQATIDYQRQMLELQLTGQAASMTQQAISVSVQLTQLAVDRLESEATATAQARGFEYSKKLDEQSARVKDNGASGAMQSLALLVAAGGATWLLVNLGNAAIARWRERPHLIPAGMQVYTPAPVQAAQLAPVPNEPQYNSDTVLGLKFLGTALAYQEDNPEFPKNQIPSDGKLKDCGYNVFITGSAWQNARDKFGALLISDRDGTFCADGDVQYLYEKLVSGKTKLGTA